MKPTKIQPQTGRILISEPSLRDMYFHRSVVLLADHNTDGSFGIILNKPLEVRLNDILKDFPHFDTEVYLGGPVSTSNLFFLHSKGDLIRNSQLIKDDLYWGGEMDDLKNLLDAGIIGKEDIRFFIGYSGWSENQLIEELQETSWLVANPSIQDLINTPPSEMWKASVSRLGKEYELWANFPDDPSLN